MIQTTELVLTFISTWLTLLGVGILTTCVLAILVP